MNAYHIHIHMTVVSYSSSSFSDVVLLLLFC